MGNLRSVEKALEHVGVEATIANDPASVRGAAGLILPGVGAFPRAMERIRELGIDDLIVERREAGIPILGICLGLQLLFDSTTELGGAAGLGLLPGEVTDLDAGGLKVPHIGWAAVTWARDSRLTEGIESGTPFYFVHSFRPRPDDGDLLGTAEYGSAFACAAERDNVFGVQFHPEKSSGAGLRLLSELRRRLRPGSRRRVILFPAIDIRGGGAVRLLQGDYERETAYDADPVDAALRWSNEGAEYLHVVDLDGARSGKPVNLDVIERIVAAVPCPVEVGGGLRDADSVAAVLRVGVERAVIGTAALRDPEFLDEMVARHGDADRRLGRRPRRQRRPRGLDRGQREERGRRRRRADRARGEAVPLHDDRGRRDDGGPGDRGAEADRRRDRCRGPRLRRGRHDRRPRGAGGHDAAQRRRRDRRPRPLRGAVHGRRGERRSGPWTRL